MQTLERKGTKTSLREVCGEQLNRLQHRNKCQNQLLDDLRYFAKQKTLLEKEYGQGLLKLSQQLIAKSASSLITKNAYKIDGFENQRLLTDVWLKYLQSTEKHAMARVKSCDVYTYKVSEVCKGLKAYRSQASKQVLDELATIGRELVNIDGFVAKRRKLYAEKTGKYLETREKLRRFNLKNASKANPHLEQDCEAAELKSRVNRNDYIMQVNVANAASEHYFNSDLPEFIALLDGEFYTDWKEMFIVMLEEEKSLLSLMDTLSQQDAQEAKKVTRDYDVQNFLIENKILTQRQVHSLNTIKGDETSLVEVDESIKEQLEREIQKNAKIVAKESKVIEKCTERLSKIVKTKSLDQRGVVFEEIFALKKSIQLSKARTMRAEAMLKSLKEGGLDIEKPLNEAYNAMTFSLLDLEAKNDQEDMSEENFFSEYDDEEEVVKQNGVDGSCSVSFTSSSKKDVSGVENLFVKSDTLLRKEDNAEDDNLYDNFNDSIYSNFKDDQANNVAETFPYTSSAIYSYTALKDDELTFHEGDVVNMVGDAGGDGWFWAENDEGRVGLVPGNYFTSSQPPPVVYASHPFHISRVAPPPPNVAIQSEQTSNNSSNNITEKHWVKALVDYEGEGVDELSFHKGQLIRVTNKSRNVDDGFWTGELRGKKGLFPSMVVEDVVVCGDDEISEVLNTNNNQHQTVNHETSSSVCQPADIDESTLPSATESNLPSSFNNKDSIPSVKSSVCTSVSQVSTLSSAVDALSSYSNLNETNKKDNIRNFSLKNEPTNEAKPEDNYKSQVQNGLNSKKSEEYKNNVKDYEKNGNFDDVNNLREKNNVSKQEITSDKKVLVQKSDTYFERIPTTSPSLTGLTTTVNEHKTSTSSITNNVAHTSSLELDENNNYNDTEKTNHDFNVKDLPHDSENDVGSKQDSTMDSYLKYMNNRYDNINDISVKDVNSTYNEIYCSYDDVNNRAKAKLQIRKKLKQLQQLQLQNHVSQGEQKKDSQITENSPSNFNVLSFNGLKDRMKQNPQSSMTSTQHQDLPKLTHRSSMQATKTTKAYQSSYYSDQKHQRPEYTPSKNQRRNRPDNNMPAFHESSSSSNRKMSSHNEDSFRHVSRSTSSTNQNFQGYDTIAYQKPNYDINNTNDSNKTYNVSTLPITLKDNRITKKSSNNNTIWINSNVRESYI